MRMNPVYKNELKMSARSMQLPVLAVIFNSILSVVALMAFDRTISTAAEIRIIR